MSLPAPPCWDCVDSNNDLSLYQFTQLDVFQAGICAYFKGGQQFSQSPLITGPGSQNLHMLGCHQAKPDHTINKPQPSVLHGGSTDTTGYLQSQTNWKHLWGVTEWSSSTLLSNFLVNKNPCEREEPQVPLCVPSAWFIAPNILLSCSKLEILSSDHRDQENCGKLYLPTEPE